VLVHVSDGAAVALSSVAWFVVSAAIGWWAVRWPDDRLGPGPVTRLRRWERSGATWQRWLRVRRWKDLVPEAGDLFAGGRSKRRIGGRSTAVLETYRRETVRAERVHWLILASTPVHALWCPPVLFAAMVVFGVVLNAPSIVIQRYNRGRLDAVLARRARVGVGSR
jgi:glycosyl-4,4'-diaponeurosporenoate acyltransferase